MKKVKLCSEQSGNKRHLMLKFRNDTGFVRLESFNNSIPTYYDVENEGLYIDMWRMYLRNIGLKVTIVEAIDDSFETMYF